MAQASSGKVLREARERKGYDLNTVARRLRIRPDILRAIEAGDFAAMPPRGYTRNMVNAYAKLLGLNPTEIVNLYLDEAYAEQVERARGSARGSGFNMQRETRRSRSQLGVGENSGAETRAIPPVASTGNAPSRQFTRDLYDDGTRFSRDDYGVTRQRAERPGKSERDFSSHHSGYDSTNTGYSGRESPNRGGRSIYAGQTPMQYTASRLPGFLQSRNVLIGLGVAVVVIIIIVLFFVLTGKKDEPQEDVSALPVSGITDTTDTESGSSAAAEVAPTSARVVYSVKSGQECYAEIYDNGKMSAENLTGPTEKTVDVTGTWTIATWTPEALTVTVDGQKAELKESSQYGGMYAYTVDFAEILKQWKATHGGAAAAAGAAAAGAAAATAAGGSETSASTSTDSSMSAQSTSKTRDDGTNYDESSDINSQLDQSSNTQEEEYVEEEPAEEQNTEEEYVDDGSESYDGEYTEEYTEDYQTDYAQEEYTENEEGAQY